MNVNELSFDVNGCLVPYELIETDWPLFERTFGWTAHRRALIDTLRSFVSGLNALTIQTVTLWVDGSFVTKKERPADIDVVVVLPSTTYRQSEQRLRSLRDQYAQLDMYFVRAIEPHERDYFLYLSDKAQWFFQFTTTKPSRTTRVKYPKGFVQLAWHDESISVSAQ